MFLCVSIRIKSRVIVPFQGIQLKEGQLSVGELLTRLQNRELGEKFFVPFFLEMSLLRVVFISRHPVFPHTPCPKFHFGSIMLQPNTTSGVEVKELLFFSPLLCKIVYLVSFNAPFEFCSLYFGSPLIFVVPL